ncbi:MAG: MFS transporter [Candidatus Bathyarchaeota archaeon]|nr:MFS transporter [Candidatus Bathyarchaeota archaeon]
MGYGELGLGDLGAISLYLHRVTTEAMERAIQALLVSIFVAMLGLGIVGPIMPLYAEDLGATFTQIGLLSSAWSISRFIFSAPAGRLSDSVSKKKVIMGGLLIYAVVSLLYIVAWDFNTLLAFRFIHGIGSAMSMPVAMAYAAELAPKGNEGKYMGNVTMAMFGGMGLGPLIGGTLTDKFSLSAPFYVMCAMTAFSLVLVLMFLPESQIAVPGKNKPRPSFKKVLSNRILLASFVFRAINALGRGAIMGFLTIFMATSIAEGGLGLSVTAAGTVLSVGQLTSAILQRPCGTLADRYNKNLLIISGGLVSALGMFSFPFTHTFWQVLGARLLFSSGSALMTPSISAIAAIEGREYGIGTTMSVLQSAMSLGMMAGPLLSGILADMFSLKPIFYVGSGISLFGVFIFTAIQWTVKNPRSPTTPLP